MRKEPRHKQVVQVVLVEMRMVLKPSRKQNGNGAMIQQNGNGAMIQTTSAVTMG